MKCWKQSPQTRCSFTLFLWYFWKYRCLKIRNCCSYSWWFEAVITDYVCCYCFTKSNTLLYTAHSQSHVSLCVVRTQSKQPKFTLCAQFIYRSTDVAQMLGHGRGWAVWAVLMWICYCWSAAKFISSIIRESESGFVVRVQDEANSNVRTRSQPTSRSMIPCDFGNLTTRS